MNAVGRVLNQKYVYGGEVWSLGAIYVDLQTRAASLLPDDPHGQRKLAETYLAGFMVNAVEVPADAPTVVVDGMTFLAAQPVGDGS